MVEHLQLLHRLVEMQWLCMQKRPRFLVSVVLVLVQTIRLELRPHW